MRDIQHMRSDGWQKTRRRGMGRFLLRHGILGFGLGLGVVAFVTLMYHRHLPVPWYPFLPIVLGLGLIGGLVWGLAAWLLMMWLHSRR